MMRMINVKVGPKHKGEITEKRTAILVGLYPDDAQRLSEMVNQYQCSKSELIRRALIEYDE